MTPYGGIRPGAGRKSKGNQKWRRISFVAPPELKISMDQSAIDLNMSISEVWRKAAELWLETNDVELKAN